MDPGRKMPLQEEDVEDDGMQAQGSQVFSEASYDSCKENICHEFFPQTPTRGASTLSIPLSNSNLLNAPTRSTPNSQCTDAKLAHSLNAELDSQGEAAVLALDDCGASSRSEEDVGEEDARGKGNWAADSEKENVARDKGVMQVVAGLADEADVLLAQCSCNSKSQCSCYSTCQQLQQQVSQLRDEKRVLRAHVLALQNERTRRIELEDEVKYLQHSFHEVSAAHTALQRELQHLQQLHQPSVPSPPALLHSSGLASGSALAGGAAGFAGVGVFTADSYVCEAPGSSSERAEYIGTKRSHFSQSKHSV
jgi:hypothetical protein